MMISFMGADDGGGTSAGGREQEVVSSGGDDAKTVYKETEGRAELDEAYLLQGLVTERTGDE